MRIETFASAGRLLPKALRLPAPVDKMWLRDMGSQRVAGGFTSRPCARLSTRNVSQTCATGMRASKGAIHAPHRFK